MKNLRLRINDNYFECKVAASPHERMKGMMGKKFNKGYDAMLFLQGKDYHCFWMKNCIIHLDIIFIENNIITEIHHNCPPCEDRCEEHYCGNGDMVLELEGGTCENLGISEGDKIKFLI